MNHTNEQERRLAQALSRCGVAQPTPELRERVLKAAREAWDTADARSADVPWPGPLLRLAASVAIAALTVFAAGVAAGLCVARWQYAAPRPGCFVSESENVAAPQGALGLASGAAGRVLPDGNAAQNLLAHMRRLQELLKEGPDKGPG